MLGKHAGEAMDGCSYVAVPFGGGMCELMHIKARTMMVADVHRHIINLANVVKEQKEDLARILSERLFHPDVLARAQQNCVELETILDEGGSLPGSEAHLGWAADYFTASWMGRSGKAGTKSEFSGGLAVRWESSGGDSVVRYRSAIKALDEWEEIAKRCQFVVMDFEDFLPKIKDIEANGVYSDAPFPKEGLPYKHSMTIQRHEKLAELLSGYEKARVVVRFYDDEIIRSLYPESHWEWRHFEGRKQSNASAPEVLLVRNA